MPPPDEPRDNLAQLDTALRQAIEDQVSPDDIDTVASADLDQAGHYIQGCLVLTAERLGWFSGEEDRWESEWHELSELSEAELIEGLGVNLLRLHGDGKIVGDYRCSLRHAKDLAGLHRKLERVIAGRDEGEGGEGFAGVGGEEGKGLRCETCGRVLPAWSDFCPSCMSRRKVLSRLFDFVKPYKWRVVIAAVLMLCVTLLQLALPLLRKPMIDKGLGGDFESPPDWPLFVRYVTLFAGSILVSLVIGTAMRRIVAKMGAMVGRDVRDKTYNHLHRLSLSFFARKRTGQLVTRITSDSERLWDFIAFTSIESISAVLTIVGVGIALFVFHWKLAIFTLFPIPAMLAMIVFFHKHMHSLMRRRMHRWGKMTSVVTDALPGVRVIKAFNQEDREVSRFQQHNQDVYNEDSHIINNWTIFGPALGFCAQISMVVVWLLGGWWMIQNYWYKQEHGEGMVGGMTFGTLMLFQGCMGMFYGPIRQIAMIDRRLNRAATSAHRIFEVLDTEPAIFSSNEARSADEMTGKIELRDVSFSYDGVRRVLKNISFTIEPGQMIGLAGPSGAGKTTLVNLISRFYDVLEGQILIDGVDVRDYDLGQLRQKIGVVLQEPFLFHGTVAENIAYGSPDCALEEIIEAARAANAHDFIVGFPDGYDTMVGERGQTLSGGERQRISIARAVIHNPRILILDEATSSVDSHTEQLIQEALERLVASRTTIAIAHRLSTLRRADKLLILKAGEMVESGTHDELAVKEDGLYASLLKMQAETQSLIGLGDGGSGPGGGHGGRGKGGGHGRHGH